MPRGAATGVAQPSHASHPETGLSPDEPTCDFTGQVALVTGAASGMGLATARAGAAVVLADLDRKAAERASEDLTDAGHRALGLGCDVAAEEQAAAMVDIVKQQPIGRLGAADEIADAVL
ncbi:SDR family NAD(P)-dependent oxidoreductase [Streptomyces sp. NRRL F-5193]|uniref:SDR family NAD(P)-dependent oxidoreductase n=1 Tax=Streptomyces sp. NRRL F-5193 TaxID=1463860 RepID=UPI003B639B67